MSEKEFELFCKDRFRNPDFILGRDRKKDPTEQSVDHFLNTEKKKTPVDAVNDISDLLGKGMVNETTSSSHSRKVTPLQKPVIASPKK
mmetsp:Transcript_23493/g.31490  ORF Transcript_23493/g.31490 Transcript_23493/m.31490 type:complete len:88 (+) Transcript_23493:302-565(+)